MAKKTVSEADKVLKDLRKAKKAMVEEPNKENKKALVELQVKHREMTK